VARFMRMFDCWVVGGGPAVPDCSPIAILTAFNEWHQLSPPLSRSSCSVLFPAGLVRFSLIGVDVVFGTFDTPNGALF